MKIAYSFNGSILPCISKSKCHLGPGVFPTPLPIRTQPYNAYGCQRVIHKRPLSSARCQATASVSTQEAPLSTFAQEEGRILAPGGEGAWDEDALGHPVVRCFVGEGEDKWLMWYSGRTRGQNGLDPVFPGAGSIGVAVSTNGIDWQRGHGAIEGARGEAKALDVGRVLEPNEEDWWWLDTRHMAVSDVQVFSSDNTSAGVYWMFYSGATFESHEAPAGLAGLQSGAEVEGLRARAGLCMSQDGRNWARLEAEHHTAAVLDAGDAGEWDAAFIGSPQVVAVGPKDMRMFYHSFDASTETWTVGTATSKDGFVWTKRGPIFAGSGSRGDFDGKGAAACHVVRDYVCKRWIMFYEAVASDDTRSISMAVSKDGLKDWARLGRPILEAGQPGSWDAGGVCSPSAVSMADGRWRLYYAGLSRKGGGATGVGLAMTDKENVEEFEGLLPTGDSNTPSILVTFISEPILHSTSRQEPVQPYEGKSGGAPAR
ncbi:hypothetical protein CVIRNUC_003820 [Coccomyxa viridis]|uniref:Arabinanase/levansucrase/invertase n=1 Tax=Coccomyxa viridis TaxID=1274662 RepID=A0AAV1I2P3_9CHLO|nr:hypothetical protein CVIRNUC_003820 [Coccomyxa viridis]